MRSSLWLGVPLLLTALAGGPAHAVASVFVDELTWSEVRDRLRAGTTTVIIPVGGTEQNGPHMVLGKHNVRVKALAGKIAATLGNALVAPVVSYVPEGSIHPPTAHMRFPGTITVPDAAFEQVIESAARSFRVHGFRDVVVLGDHGGYQKSLAKVAARLNREWAATPGRAHAIVEYYRVTETAYPQTLKGRGYGDDEIGTHAGLADTSLALAIDPGLVRPDKLASGGRARLPTAWRATRGEPPPSSGNWGWTRSSPRRSTRSGERRPGAEPNYPSTIHARSVHAIRKVFPFIASGRLARLGAVRARLGAGPGEHRKPERGRHDSGHAARDRPGQPLQRNRRRERSPRPSPATCRVSTFRTCSRTTST